MKNVIRVDGTTIAQRTINSLTIDARERPTKRVLFIIGERTAANDQFVARKSRVGSAIGVHTSAEYVEDADTASLVNCIAMNNDYDGIVVQLPLPEGVNTKHVLDAISVEQDIDMLSEAAIQEYNSGLSLRMPPVAFAVQAIIEEYDISLDQKNIVVLGHGKLVGEPVCLWLTQQGVEYTVIDITTSEEDRAYALINADIIISGIGVPHSITPDMIKDGVVLIDAGTSEHTGKLAGDIHPDCEAKASLYTPVPGGVGPLTIAGLYANLFM